MCTTVSLGIDKNKDTGENDETGEGDKANDNAVEEFV
jgi:hypothetical protein